MQQVFTPDSAVVGYIIQGVVGLVGVWMVKTVQSLAVEVRAIRVALFGMEGDNGINSHVKEALDKLEKQQELVQKLALNLEEIHGSSAR